jgi:aarF domain-containing kinase
MEELISMSRRFPRRLFRRGAICSAVGLGLLLLPPRESLPTESLLQARVLLEGVGRVGRCAVAGAIIFADYKYSLWGCADDQHIWNEVHQRSADRLVILAETNGGLYVKSGQVFASMSHILPREYYCTMRKLQDAVVSRPFSEVKTVLEQDLKKPLAGVFSFISETPIAAASLAQVHRATLASDGSDVAVKVQYIDIQARFHGDMATIRTMLGICGAAFPGFDFSNIITKLNATVAKELDFITEGRNSDRAGEDLKPIFGRNVVTPHIHWEYSSPRVLITDFVQGVKISDANGMRRLGIDVSWAANACYSALAYQMFITGFAHGDPHAGNILVHRPAADGRKWRKGESQVVILDHGLYADMAPDVRVRLARIWSAAVRHDNTELKAVCEELDIGGDVAYKLVGSMFLQHPYEHFSSFKRGMSEAELKLIQTEAQGKMKEFNDLIVKLPSDYALMLRSLSAQRAINKDLSNPVRRPLIMLRWSLRSSHGGGQFSVGGSSALSLQWALMSAWWEETKNDLLMWFLKQYQPKIYEKIEEALSMA